MNKTFSFSTDTATLVIYDLSSLKHRVSDSPDWWSIPEDEIDEINKGNVLFLNLGDDGNYVVKIIDEINGGRDSFFLNVPSGDVFIGAGEDVSGGDLEPDGSDCMAGIMIKLPPGGYEVKYNRDGTDISISFSRSNCKVNNITDLIRI
ncbi:MULTISPECIES: DUF6386 family protein [Serratia]|nr:DUF6386 family protein [Serratia proteamaculans]NWA71810.1 hypothetical protein [Serratia proteamaculans]CAI0715341.1 Uncharacterised protein [Serratia proteamaculans]CAI0746133.1 Uncharacterised protein [Serratia proteamaculans]CAI0746673.1 Uncharacterised protein [Serratia proteamaculans]CAI1593990.1 Uncharacterised protein [Serratia proteamaculans]